MELSISTKSIESNKSSECQSESKITRGRKTIEKKKVMKDPKLCDAKIISKLLVNLKLFNIYENNDNRPEVKIDPAISTEQNNKISDKDSPLNTNTCMVC